MATGQILGYLIKAIGLTILLAFAVASFLLYRSDKHWDTRTSVIGSSTAVLSLLLLQFRTTEAQIPIAGSPDIGGINGLAIVQSSPAWMDALAPLVPLGGIVFMVGFFFYAIRKWRLSKDAI